MVKLESKGGLRTKKCGNLVLLEHKNELIVFNKIDLIDKKELEKKKLIFKKKINKKIYTISTLEKNSLIKIKQILIKYVS